MDDTVRCYLADPIGPGLCSVKIAVGIHGNNADTVELSGKSRATISTEPSTSIAGHGCDGTGGSHPVDPAGGCNIEVAPAIDRDARRTTYRCFHRGSEAGIRSGYWSINNNSADLT